MNLLSRNTYDRKKNQESLILANRFNLRKEKKSNFKDLSKTTKKKTLKMM